MRIEENIHVSNFFRSELVQIFFVGKLKDADLNKFHAWHSVEKHSNAYKLENL